MDAASCRGTRLTGTCIGCNAKAAAHIFGGNIPKEKTVHDIATPDAKQKMAEQVDVLNADAAQKALQVCQLLYLLQPSSSHLSR